MSQVVQTNSPHQPTCRACACGASGLSPMGKTDRPRRCDVLPAVLPVFSCFQLLEFPSVSFIYAINQSISEYMGMGQNPIPL